MNKDILQQFIDGIFSLNTRRFGTVAELMIKELFGFEESNSKLYDLYDSYRDLRIEVKFSRAMQEYDDAIREENVIDQCLGSAILENRSFSIDETSRIRFDSNIQQIKREQFDVLFYGLFYTDCIEIVNVKSPDYHYNTISGILKKTQKTSEFFRVAKEERANGSHYT